MISFFAIGFAGWQLAAQLLFHRLPGSPLPFHSMREWWSFALVSFITGALLGAAWRYAQGCNPGWWRDWLEMLASATSIGFFVGARRFVDDPLPLWLVGLAIGTLVTATLFTFVYRFVKSALRTAAGK
jgi:hypothetical protein